jgi:hypothetical protein
VLIGDQVSAIRILSLLSPVADIALHTLWSAMGQERPPALQKEDRGERLALLHRKNKSNTPYVNARSRCNFLRELAAGCAEVPVN